MGTEILDELLKVDGKTIIPQPTIRYEDMKRTHVGKRMGVIIPGTNLIVAKVWDYQSGTHKWQPIGHKGV